jgi:4-amino-4-deoxy-L-arabinose transferase-like glycosyltransferase
VSRGNTLEAFFQHHEAARFALLTVFLAGIAAFGSWRLAVVAENGHSKPLALLLLAAIGAGMMTTTWPLLTRARPNPGERRTVGSRIAIVVALVAMIGVVPETGTRSAFWQPSWYQALGSGYLLAFAGALYWRRVRQRAWRGVH